MTDAMGKVIFVGAGPGDPGLLTLRGAECLGEADVVLYDYLASAELLENTRSGAELICLGRHGHGRLMSQQEINDAMVAHATAGRTVVRLKGGDPTIFARLGEESAALDAARIPYELVPGITAALAAGSHAGLPLTDRDHASCVAFVTGQESPQKGVDDTLNYAALASFPGTLVFYMGVTTAPQWSRELVEHGRSNDTPVAIVRRCSLADQETIFATLGSLADVLVADKVRPPAVMIVGEVAREPTLPNWFAARPLFGRRVLVTRPVEQAHAMVAALRRLGADVLYQGAIEISEPADWQAVDDAIGRLETFDWLVFSSSNGVQYFLNRLLALGRDLRALGGVKLAAIGPATVEALADFHLTADLQPETYRAEALAEALADGAAGRRFFLARASRGRETLAEMLRTSGGEVEQAVVYSSTDVATADELVADALSAGQIDWTTVTSSAIARSLVNLFGDDLKQTSLVAISPLTADVLTDLGYPPAAVADTYTTDGILAAILAAAGRKV